MEHLFLYFLKSSGLLIAFYLAYYFLLRKETFFNSNRWFLLFGLGISALLPLFFIKKIVFIESPKFVPDTTMNVSNNAALNLPEISPEVATIDWFQLIALGYAMVVFILFIKVLINIFSLSKIVRNKAVEKQEGFQLIDLKEDIAPFSFFNYIVFNSSLYSESELQSILLHEKIHSTQKHSLDVLITNLFTVIFWFNPFIYWYKKALIQNLEYIADHKAIQKIEDKKAYQKALLKVVSHQNCLPITNHFYQSLIKKRIVMLNKNQSNKRNSWKYAVIIPALVAFVFVFQIKLVAQEKLIKLADGSSISSTTREVTDMIWTKDSSDEEFKQDATVMAQSNLIFNFSDIKRNAKGEIVAIKIDYKDKLGNEQSEVYSNSEGIKPIYFKRDIDQKGKGKIGMYSENQKELIETNAKVILEDYSNQPDVPVPPTPPTPPNINFETAPFPNMPKAPNAPKGTPQSNPEGWKKFEAKIADFDKKMKELEPEIEAYTEKMAKIEDQMKPYEEEMKVFEKKMEIYEKQLLVYLSQMEVNKKK